MNCLRTLSITAVAAVAIAGCTTHERGMDAAVDAGCAEEFIRADYTVEGVRHQVCFPLATGIEAHVAPVHETPIWVVAQSGVGISVGATSYDIGPLPFVTAGTFRVTVDINPTLDECGRDAGGCRLWGECSLVVAEAAAYGAVAEGHLVGPCTVPLLPSGTAVVNEIAIRGTLTRYDYSPSLDGGR